MGKISFNFLYELMGFKLFVSTQEKPWANLSQSNALHRVVVIRKIGGRYVRYVHCLELLVIIMAECKLKKIVLK